MADKLRKTFPVKITLADGEQPTGAKLTAIATQARNGLGIAEFAIGDIWNQSGDSHFASTDDSDKRKRLHIASLGRALGNMDKVLADFDPISTNIRFYDKFTGYLNGNVGSLHQKPNGALTWSGNTVETSNPLNVDAAGEAYYDSDTGKVFSYDVLVSGDEPYYEVAYGDFSADDRFTPNLLPPATQTSSVGFGGCKVVAKDVDGSGDPISGNTRYYIVLPPRVTDVDHNNPNIDDFSPGTSNNQATSTSATPKLYYWSKSTAIDTDSDSEHYRYALPSVLDYSNFSPGDRLPDGFLKLWDDNGGGTGVGRVVDNVTFYKPATTDADHGSTYNQGFVVEVDAPDYVTELDALHSKDTEYTASDYNTGIRVITTGASVAEVLAAVWQRLLDHKHGWPGNETAISSRIRHKDLVDLDPDSGNDPFSLNSIDVRLLKSNWQHDDHLQYLSRAGSQDWSSTDARDIYNNAFLGDFVIGSISVGTAPFFNNLDANSFSLYFGEHSTDAPRMFYNYSAGELQLDNKSLSLGEGILDLGHVSDNSNAYRLQATGGYCKLLKANLRLQDGVFAAGKLRADNAASSTLGSDYSLLEYNALTFTGASTIGTNAGNLTLDPNGILQINASVRGQQSQGALRIVTDQGYLDMGPQSSAYCHLNTGATAFKLNKELFVEGAIGSDGTDLILKTSGDERLRVLETNGNVGIGKTPGSYKLDVGGTINGTTVSCTAVSCSGNVAGSLLNASSRLEVGSSNTHAIYDSSGEMTFRAKYGQSYVTAVYTFKAYHTSNYPAQVDVEGQIYAKGVSGALKADAGLTVYGGGAYITGNVTINGNLTATNIDSGITVVPPDSGKTYRTVPANSYITETIAFNHLFGSTPTVVACLRNNNAGDDRFFTIEVYDESSSSFKYRLMNSSSSARWYTTGSIAWIAMA